jgi:hypothetical protein
MLRQASDRAAACTRSFVLSRLSHPGPGGSLEPLRRVAKQAVKFEDRPEAGDPALAAGTAGTLSLNCPHRGALCALNFDQAARGAAGPLHRWFIQASAEAEVPSRPHGRGGRVAVHAGWPCVPRRICIQSHLLTDA